LSLHKIIWSPKSKQQQLQLQLSLHKIISSPRSKQKQLQLQLSLHKIIMEPQEQAARAGEHEEESEEESEEDDELQLCHLSSFEGSSDDTSSTDEDRRGFQRELKRNPALRATYARSEEARRQLGHFNARPGHFWSRKNTRGRETRRPDN
jgi:hypothetical protein